MTVYDNMICIILVAGHETSLDEEIRNDVTGQFSHLEGTPKALLPGVGGKRILDYWWDLIKNRQLFSQVFLVCTADKYKYFERWASGAEFPVDNIINDGTTSYDTRLGAVSDLDLCLRVKSNFCQNENVMVVAGDMMFQVNLTGVAALFFKMTFNKPFYCWYLKTFSQNFGIVYRKFCIVNRIVRFEQFQNK